MQVHGGMGYIEETGAAQLFRDARIAAIYEGTNGIQAIDLVTRKLPLAGGAVVEAYLGELRRIVEAVNATNDPALGWTGVRLRGSRREPGAHDALAARPSRQGRRPGAGRSEPLSAAVRHRRPAAACWRSRRSPRCGSTPTPPRIALARFFAENFSVQAAALERTVVEGARALSRRRGAA